MNTNQIIKQAPKYKLIFKDELWDYINDSFGHQKASYHTNNIMKSVDKLLDQAITQAVEEKVEEVESKLLKREDYYAYGDLVHVRQTLKEIKDKLTK